MCEGAAGRGKSLLNAYLGGWCIHTEKPMLQLMLLYAYRESIGIKNNFSCLAAIMYGIMAILA